MSEPAAEDQDFHLLTWLRNSFAAGVAIVLPFLVTIWVVWTVVAFIDKHVLPVLPSSIRPAFAAIPGAGVVVAVIALTIVGALAANLVGRFMVQAGEQFIANLPLVRSIYGGSKQIFRQITAPERTSFQEAALVEFPRPGVWMIGFVTNEQTDDVSVEATEPLVAVYVPHAPIPASGFLIYVARSALKPIPLGAEESLKRVISLGIAKTETEQNAT